MIQVAHTADVDPATLRAARALLERVFEGDFEDSDWEHSLGGMHALAWEGDELVGHASLIQRRLLHRGRALRAGYVEGVGVRADRQRRGHAAAMMDGARAHHPRAPTTSARWERATTARGSTRPAAGSAGRARPRRSRPKA